MSADYDFLLSSTFDYIILSCIFLTLSMYSLSKDLRTLILYGFSVLHLTSFIENLVDAVLVFPSSSKSSSY